MGEETVGYSDLATAIVEKLSKEEVEELISLMRKHDQRLIYELEDLTEDK